MKRSILVVILMAGFLVTVSGNAWADETTNNPFAQLKAAWAEAASVKATRGYTTTALRTYMVTKGGMNRLSTDYLGFFLSQWQARQVCHDLGWPRVAELPGMDLVYVPPDPGERFDAILLIYYDGSKASEILFMNANLP